jgi:hypothetical protein
MTPKRSDPTKNTRTSANFIKRFFERRQHKKIVKKTRKFLERNNKIQHFRAILKTCGRLNVSFGHLVHVHFEEGLDIRTFLRTLKYTKKWTDRDFDDKWEQVVIDAIKD